MNAEPMDSKTLISLKASAWDSWRAANVEFLTLALAVLGRGGPPPSDATVENLLRSIFGQGFACAVAAVEMAESKEVRAMVDGTVDGNWHGKAEKEITT